MSLSQGEMSQDWELNAHPHLAPILSEDTAHLYLSSKPAWHVTEQLYF
jgi:hypothetical protein